MVSPIMLKFGVTPNMITTLNLFFGVCSLFALATNRNILAVVSIFFMIFVDCFDGAYAYLTNQTTAFGAFWDNFVDFTCITLVFVGIVFQYPIIGFYALVIHTIDCYHETCRLNLHLMDVPPTKKSFKNYFSLGAIGERLFLAISLLYNPLFKLVLIFYCVFGTIRLITHIAKYCLSFRLLILC